MNKCPFIGFSTREDAIDRAEQSAMVVNDDVCPTCGQWHMRPAHGEEEAEDAALSYRRELARKFPALAKQRGWAE